MTLNTSRLFLLVAAIVITGFGCSSKEQCSADADCDDGSFCNGAELCRSNGSCGAGVAPDLDDGIACTDDACDEVTDSVVHDESDAACDDGLFCNGVETCSAHLDCLVGTAPLVDDGIACTTDRCDEDLDRVVNAGDNTSCADVNDCTSDACTAGIGCTHQVVCQCSKASDCNDSNPCTDDVCNAGTCVYGNNTAACDDGSYCNGADTCSAGACSVHGGNPCTGGAQCANVCNEAADTCIAATGTSCNDGVFCNGADTCSAGACSMHTGNPCAACNATCIEPNAVCQNPPAEAPIISPATGVYTTGQVISMTTTSPNASIFFTTDGSAPSAAHGTPYTSPFVTLIPTDYAAVASGVCYTPSPITSSTIDVRDDLRLIDACSTLPAVAWSGSRWGIAWVSPSESLCEDSFSDWATLSFAVMRADGTLVAPPLRITTDPSVSRASWPAVVWNGTSFSVVWMDARDTATRHKIYFAKVDHDGALVDLPAGEPDGVDDNQVRLFAGARDEEMPAVVWDGMRHVVGWVDDGHDTYTDVYTAFVDVNGNKLDLPANEADGTDDNETLVSSNRFWISMGPSLAWTGSQLGVAWSELRPNFGLAQAYFGRVSATGAKLGTEFVLSTSSALSSYASVAWTGARYAVAWQSGFDQLRATFIDTNGVIASTPNLGTGSTPSWVWSAADTELVASYANGSETWVSEISAAGLVRTRLQVSASGGTAKTPRIAPGPTKRSGLVWRDGLVGAGRARFSNVLLRP